MGQVLQILSIAIRDTFPANPTFSTDDISDLTGKVVLVTGGSAGIGKETVKVLLQHNARVYMAARAEQKARDSIQELAKITGKEAIYLPLDLSSLKSVKAAAEEFTRKESTLHVLFNNAGVMAPPIEQVTSDGYDLQIGTNVLGHFYLTKLLIPSLLEGAKSSNDGKARVINVSSVGHIGTSGLDFNMFKDGPARKRMGTDKMYFMSKFGNVVFSNELARRYSNDIISCSLNPGNIKTELSRHFSRFRNFMLKPILYPVSYGALSHLYAGTTQEGLELNGKYLAPWARLSEPRKETQDPQLGKALWEWCEEQVKDI